MMNGRQSLDFDDLDDFAPRQPESPPAASQKAVDRVAAFPSREGPEDGQINIKASQATLERFRQLAKAERYRHGEFLDILMDAYEGREGR